MASPAGSPTTVSGGNAPNSIHADLANPTDFVSLRAGYAARYAEAHNFGRALTLGAQFIFSILDFGRWVGHWLGQCKESYSWANYTVVQIKTEKFVERYFDESMDGSLNEQKNADNRQQMVEGIFDAAFKAAEKKESPTDKIAEVEKAMKECANAVNDYVRRRANTRYKLAQNARGHALGQSNQVADFRGRNNEILTQAMTSAACEKNIFLPIELLSDRERDFLPSPRVSTATIPLLAFSPEQLRDRWIQLIDKQETVKSHAEHLAAFEKAKFNGQNFNAQEIDRKFECLAQEVLSQTPIDWVEYKKWTEDAEALMTNMGTERRKRFSLEFAECRKVRAQEILSDAITMLGNENLSFNSKLDLLKEAIRFGINNPCVRSVVMENKEEITQKIFQAIEKAHEFPNIDEMTLSKIPEVERKIQEIYDARHNAIVDLFILTKPSYLGDLNNRNIDVLERTPLYIARDLYDGLVARCIFSKSVIDEQKGFKVVCLHREIAELEIAEQIARGNQELLIEKYMGHLQAVEQLQKQEASHRASLRQIDELISSRN